MLAPPVAADLLTTVGFATAAFIPTPLTVCPTKTFPTSVRAIVVLALLAAVVVVETCVGVIVTPLTDTYPLEP